MGGPLMAAQYSEGDRSMDLYREPLAGKSARPVPHLPTGGKACA
jgi:hypothetical protein